VFEPQPIWLACVLLLLLACPILSWLVYRRLALRGRHPRVCVAAMALSLLLALPLLLAAPFLLPDPFEGPGIWLFFAIHALGAQILILAAGAGVLIRSRGTPTNSAGAGL
jgi:hypothetical protein